MHFKQIEANIRPEFGYLPEVKLIVFSTKVENIALNVNWVENGSKTSGITTKRLIVAITYE